MEQLAVLSELKKFSIAEKKPHSRGTLGQHRCRSGEFRTDRKAAGRTKQACGGMT
jgi:hypothetical protein